MLLTAGSGDAYRRGMFCDLRAGVILVAEDNPDEALLLQRAFKKAGLQVRIHICEDGDDATAYLLGKEEFADRVKFPYPRMLITDLKMPRCDGFELLERMRSEELVPKVVMSASGEDRDVRRAYKLGANCYFLKPGTFEELVCIVRALGEFWGRVAVPLRG